MYLNLDLLYNTYNYLFPLFYYQYYSDDLYEIYSPMTKKSVYKNCDYVIYFDFITKKYEYLAKIFDFDDTDFISTENTLMYYDSILEKCKPFKLNKEYLYFLKSNTRIN